MFPFPKCKEWSGQRKEALLASYIVVIQIKMALKILVTSAFLILYVTSQTYNPPNRASSTSRRRSRQRTNATTPDSENENIDEPPHEEITDNGAAIGLLQKINDRLTGMSAVNEQQLRRLETFEYRITKLEVQIQEKLEGLRNDLKEVGRRTQQLDWQSSKTESVLDTLKSDSAFFKQAIEHFRVSYKPSSEPNIGSHTDVDVTNKLGMIFRGTQSLLNSVQNLQYDMTLFKRNLTNIGNTSSILDTYLPQVLTTKHFQQSMVDFSNKNSHQQTYTSNPIGNDLAQDCSQVAGNKSGVFRIKPVLATHPFFVYCDFDSKSSRGWTVIQRRTEGTLEFYKGWHDYKHGFGNIGGEFWLGLEKIHLLTNFNVNEIYIELEDFTLEKAYAHYSAFAIGSETEGYPISFLGAYEGTAGDSLNYHAGQKFSTFDMDHDNWPEGNCAQSHTGAWWFNGCDTSNLNGRYLNGELPDQYEYGGMYWYEWHGPKYSLKASKIMVRPFQDQDTMNTATQETSDEDYMPIG